MNKRNDNPQTEAWVKVDAIVAKAPDVAKLAKAAGLALATYKAALERMAAPATPQGKVARFSFKGMDADGMGVKFAFCDAPKAKAAAAPKAAQTDPFAGWSATPSGTLFKKAGDGRKVRK